MGDFSGSSYASNAMQSCIISKTKTTTPFRQWIQQQHEQDLDLCGYPINISQFSHFICCYGMMYPSTLSCPSTPSRAKSYNWKKHNLLEVFPGSNLVCQMVEALSVQTPMHLHCNMENDHFFLVSSGFHVQEVFTFYWRITHEFLFLAYTYCRG